MHPNVRRFGVPAAACAALLAPLVVTTPAQAAESCSTRSFSSLVHGMTMPRVEALMNCSGVVTRVQAVKQSDGSWVTYTYKTYAGPGADVRTKYSKLNGVGPKLVWMARP